MKSNKVAIVCVTIDFIVRDRVYVLQIVDGDCCCCSVYGLAIWRLRIITFVSVLLVSLLGGVVVGWCRLAL